VPELRGGDLPHREELPVHREEVAQDLEQALPDGRTMAKKAFVTR
jgi:hypothetical protein